MSALRSAIVLGMLGCLGACSTQPPKVSCERHLTPINVPQPVGSASHPAPQPAPRPGPVKSATHEAGGAHGRR